MIGRPYLYPRVKPLADRMIAALACMVLAPLVAVLCVLIHLDSRGPAFYRQVRVGKNGRRFRILKLRSMVTDAEAGTGPVWARPSDDRVTKLGHFLRRTHLDELPQLWNVLVGDMRLVGPRPERPLFVDRLSRQVSGYRRRLDITPGITGLAQIFLPPDVTLRDVRRKLAYDLIYGRRVSLVLDVFILYRTTKELLTWRRRPQLAPVVATPVTMVEPPATTPLAARAEAMAKV